MPEFLSTGTNYFSVTLDRRGDITMNYGATNRSDAIVGVTQGGGAADPGPIDISRTWLSAIGTTYEQFTRRPYRSGPMAEWISRSGRLRLRNHDRAGSGRES